MLIYHAETSRAGVTSRMTYNRDKHMYYVDSSPGPPLERSIPFCDLITGSRGAKLEENV